MVTWSCGRGAGGGGTADMVVLSRGRGRDDSPEAPPAPRLQGHSGDGGRSWAKTAAGRPCRARLRAARAVVKHAAARPGINPGPKRRSPINGDTQMPALRTPFTGVFRGGPPFMAGRAWAHFAPPAVGCGATLTETRKVWWQRLQAVVKFASAAL